MVLSFAIQFRCYCSFNYAINSPINNQYTFCVALQIQQSRAFVHNINLLASGASIPIKATTGTGFYSGRNGAVKAFISDIATTKVLVATMPKVPGTPMITKPTDVQHFIPKPENGANRSETLELGSENLENFNIHWLNFVENTTQIGQVCQNGVCCNYKASASVSTDDVLNSVCAKET